MVGIKAPSTQEVMHLTRVHLLGGEALIGVSEMHAQKGAFHTRANSEERSHQPGVTSESGVCGGWNSSS
jgi:hypothetical protein